MRGLHVVVLGSGASADYGYPLMGTLAGHLQNAVVSPPASEPQWSLISSQLRAGVDLETALTETHCSDELINEVIAVTWDYVSRHDP